MAAPTETAPPARLKVRYLEEIRPALMDRFGYSTVMQAPKLVKITLNMGVGLAKQDSKMLKAATEQLATIAGQQPNIRRARKSIAAFKLREGMPVGVAVTLRGERSYEFLDRLVSIAIPRIRDFRGLSPRSFDGRGNYSMGVREQIIFPEVDYDAIDQVRGLDITITTTAATDAEAYALLSALGMPFAAQGRPRGFEPDDAGDGAQDEDEDAGNGAGAQQAQAAEPQAAEPETAEPQAAEPQAAEPETAEQAAEPEAAEPEAAEPATDEAQDADPQAAEPDAEAQDAEPEAAEPQAAEAQAAEAAEPEAAEPQENDPAGTADADTTEKESTD
jgi:large subunit ribosomal protein L5